MIKNRENLENQLKRLIALIYLDYHGVPYDCDIYTIGKSHYNSIYVEYVTYHLTLNIPYNNKQEIILSDGYHLENPRTLKFFTINSLLNFLDNEKNIITNISSNININLYKNNVLNFKDLSSNRFDEFYYKFLKFIGRKYITIEDFIYEDRKYYTTYNFKTGE